MLDSDNNIHFCTKTMTIVCMAFFLLGLGGFISGIYSDNPKTVWQSFLISFLVFSGISAGGVLFSAIMHLSRARWTGPLAGLSESFAAFFPISFIAFCILFVGRESVFPWLHMDLNGKEVWLNIPFLFFRDISGLLILYMLGLIYLLVSLKLRLLKHHEAQGNMRHGKIHDQLISRMLESPKPVHKVRKIANIIAGFYIAAFALVLSLLGYDLIMSADPHWVSTLFGAYHFVKAMYMGMGALIILAFWFHHKLGIESGLEPSHFHDMGKLFFVFCLLWADFFYVQFFVIWYGNIPEETAYIIQRTMTPPWNGLAWTVFAICFMIPFVVLLNRAIKSRPVFMSLICSLVIIGIWLEHVLLLGPVFHEHAVQIPFSLVDVMIFLSFLGMMIFSILRFIDFMPEFMWPAHADAADEKEGFE